MTDLQNIEEDKPQAKHLKDYKKPDFSISQVHLTFELHDTQTVVTSQLEIKRETTDAKAPLILKGERLKLLSVKVDNSELSEDSYAVDDKKLTLPSVPNQFKVNIQVEINPEKNTFLDGLYKSKGIFCTQNEPEGFRKITYFLDRPDVMSVYTTKIIAEKAKYPILLSNGNKVEFGDLDEKRHYAVWKDPFKKPAYLFALVAGDLSCIEDEYVRRSGKPVKLQIFCEKGAESKCSFSMEALKKSMKWDEDVFDLEYDLDIFMIVAVEAFNAGAMENKGLNIFNISCILADIDTATDDNFVRVEKVIAHEYFHNWTGDRVTLRDWFQLTLKEGLTVFRDQEFTSDMHSRPVHRIENVSILRAHQFAEDAGPTAHPIRPASYIEMNNFYTTTVYDKGSEIIRMVYTLIGKENFFKSMKKYFELYDGMAVTCDDFIHAMELGSGKNLSQFKRWYEQKGTPHLDISFEYYPEEQKFKIKVDQSNPKESENAPPLHFPLKIGLLNGEGKDYKIENPLEIKEKSQTFTFDKIDQKPYVSLNRDFSAPVKIRSPLSIQDYLFLMAHDSNEFNRWESTQEVAMQIMLSLVESWNEKTPSNLNSDYISSFGQLLQDAEIDHSFKALALSLPSESLMGQRQKEIQFNDNFSVREWVKEELANAHEELFLEIYQKLNKDQPYKIEAKQMGDRKLKNTCLSYLCHLNKNEYYSLCMTQFKEANNMTDQFAALSILNRLDLPERREAMEIFYKKWKNEVLVITKWFSLEALCPLPGSLARVQDLLKNPAFDYKIPNIARSVIGSFFENHIHFHALDGSGYAFASDQIAALDEINPSVAARLSTAFKKFPKLDSKRQEMMKASLEKLLSKKNLSRNTFEIISKSLNATE